MARSLRRARLASLAVTILVIAPVLSAASRAAEAGGGSPSTPPVLLHDSLLLTPPEAAGTGLAPEVKVRVTVDPLGRVETVEMLSIEPSSEHDDAFRKALERTIGSWRYAPALEDGEPVAATFQWTIQFKERTGRASEGGAGFLRLGTIVDDASRAARIYSLPAERQAEMLRGYSEVAQRHFDPGNLRRAETEWFVLLSDSPNPEAVSVLARNLQAIFQVLDETFRPELALYPSHFKVAVFVFWSRSELHAFASELGAAEWADGFYGAPGLLAFPLEADNAERLLDVMIHEATHAYAARFLERPGARPAPWFTEGLASYFGQSEIKKGRLVLGSVREGRYVLDPYFSGAYRRKTDAGWSLDRVREAVRKRETVTPDELIEMDPAIFYSEDISLHYALSWLLVHYLRHGEPGWADEEFPRLVLYLGEGYPAADAIEAVYGIAPADLDAPFRAYVKSF